MCANYREWADGMTVATRQGHGPYAAPASARTEAEWISWRGERVQAPPHRGAADPGRRQSHAGERGARAGRALGLEGTYLLRLMREFEVRIPPPPGPWRRGNGENGHAAPPDAGMPRAALTSKEKAP